MQAEIERQNRGGDKITGGYASMQVMDEMRIEPERYAGLHPWDRALIGYFMTMKTYYNKRALDRAKKEKR